MTSGNISDEPLICKNETALEKLADIADVFLMHNREIYRQVDDSIVQFVNETPVFIRRARGYVPAPIFSEQNCENHIFAAGADMKNMFCLVKSDQFICSEHIGDLEDADVYRHYINSIEHLQKLFEVEPKTIVCDLHPGYFSSQYAHSIANTKVIEVQHHWAHIASVLAEYNITGPVIGLACDGTGYGTDGAIWGCECLIASLDSFERFGHLAYYPLAGGDRASKEPIRPVLSLLKKTYGNSFKPFDFDWLLDKIEPQKNKRNIILEQLEKEINTVETSSLGRIFDAVAAMLGLGNYNHFEAQLPMELEAIILGGVEKNYDFEITVKNGTIEIDFAKMIKGIVSDIKNKTLAGVISAKFHNCIAAALTEMAKKAKEKTAINIVALSGGVFCNRYLTTRLISLLNKNDFNVLYNKSVPANDAGIALGQAAIAANIVARYSSPVAR